MILNFMDYPLMILNFMDYPLVILNFMEFLQIDRMYIIHLEHHLREFLIIVHINTFFISLLYILLYKHHQFNLQISYCLSLNFNH